MRPTVAAISIALSDDTAANRVTRSPRFDGLFMGNGNAGGKGGAGRPYPIPKGGADAQAPRFFQNDSISAIVEKPPGSIGK